MGNGCARWLGRTDSGALALMSWVLILGCGEFDTAEAESTAETPLVDLYETSATEKTIRLDATPPAGATDNASALRL